MHMKTLIIYNHPHEGSFCSAIRDAVMTGLQTGGHAHKLINLDADGFDPVMREKDLAAFVEGGKHEGMYIEGIDPLVRSYIDKMRWAERIVMIFPVWWMSTPAMTKGFIDKVIFPGMVYRMEGRKLVSMLTRLKQVVIITTMNTPAAIYETSFRPSILYTIPGNMTLSMKPLVMAGVLIHQMGKIITMRSAQRILSM